MDNDCDLSFILFAESTGEQKSGFLKPQYEEMMPEQLQSHPSVCRFYRV